MSRKKKPEVIIPDPPPEVPSGLPTIVDDRVWIAHDDSPTKIERSKSICPTCGTAKAGNRCDVCGHQEKDT